MNELIAGRRHAIVLGPPMFGFGEAIARAFRSLGWSCDPIYYASPPFNPISSSRRLAAIAERVRGASVNRTFRDDVIPAILSRNPSIVVVLKGLNLNRDNAEFVRSSGTTVIAWTWDSTSRRPAQMDFSSPITHRFCTDGGDADGGRSTWLPLGFDEQVFRPRASPPDIDILLSGSLGRNYATRRACVDAILSSDLPSRYTIWLSGLTGDRMSRWRRTRRRTVTWLTRSLPMEQLACLTARAKVCINVHQDDGLQPVGPMLFAIPGCGVCQVAEARPYLATWLEPGLEYVPFEAEDLCDVLRRVLSNEGERLAVAARGYARAMRDHTFVSRVKTLLQTIGLS